MWPPCCSKRARVEGPHSASLFFLLGKDRPTAALWLEIIEALGTFGDAAFGSLRASALTAAMRFLVAGVATCCCDGAGVLTLACLVNLVEPMEPAKELKSLPWKPDKTQSIAALRYLPRLGQFNMVRLGSRCRPMSLFGFAQASL